MATCLIFEAEPASVRAVTGLQVAYSLPQIKEEELVPGEFISIWGNAHLPSPPQPQNWPDFSPVSYEPKIRDFTVLVSIFSLVRKIYRTLQSAVFSQNSISVLVMKKSVTLKWLLSDEQFLLAQPVLHFLPSSKWVWVTTLLAACLQCQHTLYASLDGKQPW